MPRLCLTTYSNKSPITLRLIVNPANAKTISLVRYSSTKLPPPAPTVMTTPSLRSTLDSTNNTSDTDTASLLSRIAFLESRLRETTSQLNTALSHAQHLPQQPPSPPRYKKPPRPFNASRFSTRFIALKFAYLGSSYNGYEHANGTVPAKPTVEEVLWKALRKTRLISPKVREGGDESFDVVWGEKEREERYGLGSLANGYGAREGGYEKRKGVKLNLDISWDGCEYSKCGRTDKGVSAFGQVIGVRVRSNRPVSKPRPESEEDVEDVNGSVVGSTVAHGTTDENENENGPMPDVPSFQDLSDASSEPPFTDASELPYISLLNAVLPSTIRILAWCPNPPPGFDARISCRERQYKYFFTNPAFLPTPGPTGMKFADGRPSELREGWLDINKMREAAAKLIGTKDYRNLCKIDASKQMSTCVRRVTYAGIEERSAGASVLTKSEHLNGDGMEGVASRARKMGIGEFVDEGPRVYAFTVHGSAFLWHQVRCMMAVLFLVGQGLEQPSVVDELLDVHRNPRKPHYEMADDTPLVLWDCIFSDDNSSGEKDFEWVYSGDEKSIPSLTTKHDGKFGLGGVVDSVWSQWRTAKIHEVLASSLLDLTLNQGDGSALERGGFRDPTTASRSQKVFDGSENARVAGTYVALMQRAKMQTLEEQNARYLSIRKVRKDGGMEAEVEDDQ